MALSEKVSLFDVGWYWKDGYHYKSAEYVTGNDYAGDSSDKRRWIGPCSTSYVLKASWNARWLRCPIHSVKCEILVNLAILGFLSSYIMWRDWNFKQPDDCLEVGSGLATVVLITAAISCLIYCSVKRWWDSEVLDMQLCFCGLNDFCRVAKGTQVSFLQVHHLGHFPHRLLWWCSTTYGGWVLQELQTNSPHSLGTLVNIMSNHNTWCPIDDVCLYLRINCVQENNLVFSLYISGCRLCRQIS